MKRVLFPDAYYDSVFHIDYKKLWKEGIRGLLFDIDNTLTIHNERAEKKEAAFFKHLRKIGFRTVLISNNSKKRVEPFANMIKSPFVSRAKKPLSSGYLRAMHMIGTNISNSLFIGDQLYTDIIGANRIGLKNILVRPISPKEAFWIKLKRIFEIPVITMYETRYKKNNLSFKGESCET